jgi:hypothetical protein
MYIKSFKSFKILESNRLEQITKNSKELGIIKDFLDMSNFDGHLKLVGMGIHNVAYRDEKFDFPRKIPFSSDISFNHLYGNVTNADIMSNMRSSFFDCVISCISFDSPKDKSELLKYFTRLISLCPNIQIFYLRLKTLPEMIESSSVYKFAFLTIDK